MELSLFSYAYSDITVRLLSIRDLLWCHTVAHIAQCLNLREQDHHLRVPSKEVFIFLMMSPVVVNNQRIGQPFPSDKKNVEFHRYWFELVIFVLSFSHKLHFLWSYLQHSCGWSTINTVFCKCNMRSWLGISSAGSHCWDYGLLSVPCVRCYNKCVCLQNVSEDKKPVKRPASNDVDGCESAKKQTATSSPVRMSRLTPRNTQSPVTFIPNNLARITGNSPARPFNTAKSSLTPPPSSPVTLTPPYKSPAPHPKSTKATANTPTPRSLVPHILRHW